MLFSSFENALDPHTQSPRQIVLALSGGMDSRVMLDLLGLFRDIHPQHEYLILHVHHGLSKNADQWLMQCERWSTDLGFAFQGLRVKLDTEGESLESAARKARYLAIEGQIKSNALVLTAQHADDQVETFLLALKRGSGPAGLGAMPQIRALGQGELLRPFLQVTRDEIARYAHQNALLWAEDESNEDCRFDRNFIRNEWLPLAQKRWPGLKKAIHRAAELCADQEALLNELLIEHDKRIIHVNGGLLTEALKGYSIKMQSALVRRWFKKAAKTALSYVQLQEVFKCVVEASSDANPKLQIGTWQIRRHQDLLFILPTFKNVANWQGVLNTKTPLLLPDGIGLLSLTFHENKQKIPSALMMAKPAENETVCIGFEPEGLWAHPLGRQGRRKLKKLFQEYGVPTWARKRTPLVFYGEELAAVADLFVCKGFEGNTCSLEWKK